MILFTDRRKMHCLDGTKDLIKGLLILANHVQADMQNNALDFKMKFGKNGSQNFSGVSKGILFLVYAALLLFVSESL